MRLYSNFLVNPNYGVDDFIEMNLEIDLPANLLEDGSIVHQYVSLYPTEYGTQYGFESAICSAVIDGDEDDAEVIAFYGYNRLDDEATWSGVAIDDLNDDEKDDYSNYELSEWGYYTYDSWFAEGNRVQGCTINLMMPKDEREVDLFTEYTIIVGARIYTDESDTEPTNFEAKRFKFDLKEPNYSITDSSIYDNFGSADEFGGIE